MCYNFVQKTGYGKSFMMVDDSGKINYIVGMTHNFEEAYRQLIESKGVEYPKAKGYFETGERIGIA